MKLVSDVLNNILGTQAVSLENETMKTCMTRDYSIMKDFAFLDLNSRANITLALEISSNIFKFHVQRGMAIESNWILQIIANRFEMVDDANGGYPKLSEQEIEDRNILTCEINKFSENCNHLDAKQNVSVVNAKHFIEWL
jgi:hypothetical protein